jgi:uncharacterized protein (DUF1330 family)
MFDRKTLLTVLVTGIVAGGAVQLLHAQTTPVSITVSEIIVKDQEAYKTWLPDVQKSIAEHGGKYLAGGFNKTTTIVGEPPPNRVVVIQYASIEAAKKWFQDAGDAYLKKAEKFATFRIYAVEGVEQK